MDNDALLRLLRRFQAEGVDYILIGGFAVRLNGFVRATEDIDVLLPSSVDNGRKVIRALDFLPSSRELDPAWFEADPEEPDSIRVADELLIDLHFAANGHSYENLLPHVRVVNVHGVPIRTLDVQGLLKTKTTGRDKDRADLHVLERLRKDVGRLDPIRQTRMVKVDSTAVSRMGFDPQQRVLVVQFTGNETVYGYPNLAEEEVSGLLAVLENHDSLGSYINSVIKPNHDHERVQF
jgi:hypothetical protein